MMGKVLQTCLLVLVATHVSSSATVTTLNGDVRGETRRVLSSDVDVFWGIPFAEPPVGDLRFQKPAPVKSWSGVKDAVVKPKACFQGIDTAFGQFKGVDMWNSKNVSEDCLFLNIWSPQTTRSLPVLVWIYGGGYWSGSSTLDIYDGAYLAAQNDVIVVSMNYRVGPLGFLYLGIDETPGNLGLHDQQLAMKWVKDNIQKFRGDPNKITLFGESAGGASVGQHMISPKSSSLFHNAAIMSGSPLTWWSYMTTEDAIARAETLGKSLECDTKSRYTIFECLKNADAQNLTDNQWNVMRDLYFDVTFGPIVDGDFFPDSPHNLVKQKKIKSGSLIAGVVHDEGIYWLLYGMTKYFGIDKKKVLTDSDFYSAISRVILPMNDFLINSTIFQYTSQTPKSESSYSDILDDVSGDMLFKCATLDFATAYANMGYDVYVYSFNHVTSGSPWPHWLGAMHGYEVDHFMAQPLNPKLNYTDDERDLSTTISRFLSNLAKTGNPNKMSDTETTKTTWPKYTAESEKYLALDIPKIKEKTGLRHSECAYWREMVPQLKSVMAATQNCNGVNHSASLHLLTAYTTVLSVMLSILISRSQ